MIDFRHRVRLPYLALRAFSRNYGQRVGWPAVESLRLEWRGWLGFRRGIASNLYELTGQERIYCTRALYLVGFVIHADFGNMGRLLAGLQL
jgi:hypothetical protein